MDEKNEVAKIEPFSCPICYEEFDGSELEKVKKGARTVEIGQDLE